MKSTFINVFISKNDSALNKNQYSLQNNTHGRRIKNPIIINAVLIAFIVLGATIARAQSCYTNDFSTALTLSPTQAANAWYTDRFAPGGFVSQSTAPDSRSNTLKHSILAADAQVDDGRNTQSGSNTQGRTFDLPAATKNMEISLFISLDFNVTGRRIAGFWGTAFNSTNAISAYPIIEFTTSSDGSGPRFRGYESGTGTWVDMGLPTGFAFGQWVRLQIKLLATGEFEYKVVTAQGTLTQTTTTNGAQNSASIGNVILQGYNTPLPTPGISYDIFWDNFAAGSDALVRNTSTGELFCTIQAAINDSDTENGHTLIAPAGIYNEEVTVNKSLIIHGANVGIAGNGTRTAESVIDGNNGAHGGFAITANNVTIDGFKIQGVAGTYGAGVYSSPTTSGLTLQNNIITDNVIGAYPSSNGASLVKNNLFDGNNRGGSAGGAGIYVESTNNLTIDGNEFRGHLNNSAIVLAANSVPAHQNLIITRNYIHDNNNTSSMVYLNGVNNGTISFNTVIQSGATAVKIAGGNSNISIINNLLDGNFTAIKIQNDGPGVNTGIQAHENSLVSTKSIDNMDAATINANCNWYGSVVPGDVAAKISGPVSYTPFTSVGTDTNGSAAGFVPAPNSCIFLIHNITHAKDFGTIQEAINDPITIAGDIIKIDAGTFTETFTVSKSLIFEGAGKDVCGTATRPASETILNAPLSGGPSLIGISGTVSATFNGFKFAGNNLANITQANQNLTISNSILELTFLPSGANVYFNSATLNLNCNYFKAISGTNNGAASHVFFSGSALNVNNNKFTSEAARTSMNNSVTSLPVWMNITSNANNVDVEHNEFDKIDIGILLADNAGNVKIVNNDFNEAKRETIPFGSGMGAGIAIFGTLNPAGPISIRNNKFHNSETGIRTSGEGTNFPTSSLLEISYNSFESMSDKAIRIGSTYASATNKLNALCNWFGNPSGPTITATNDGGTGTQILDGNGRVAFKNWLIYGTDAVSSELGFQLPTTVNVSNVGNSSVAVNNFRILSNAIGCAVTGQTIALSGTFDYTGIALTEWAKGNDGDAVTTADNYVITAPANLDNIIITGPATITGPGDVATANLEGFLSFDNGHNRNWDISGLTIKDFDLGIGFFSTANYPTNNSDVKIHDNVFYIPKDLNATAASADVNQNIGIHLANGANQIVNNNTVYIDGTGESIGGTVRSASNFLQSHTTGGNGYDGLKITNNKIFVTGLPQPEPNQAVIRGIWENSHSTGSAIEISGNTFENTEAGNTANLNRQFAFWVTSRSGNSNSVVYKNNEVKNFAEGIGWLGGPFTGNTPPVYEASASPVQILNNKFTGVTNGVVVRRQPGGNPGSPAIIFNNSFNAIPTGGFAISNQGEGLTDASCNWYDNPLTINTVNTTGGGGITFLPKLSNGNDADVAAGFQLDGANICVLPVKNLTQNLTYLTIQAAINAANGNDEILVGTGVYPENVIVDKSVKIYGVDSTNVILDKGDANFIGSGGVGFSLQANGITLSKMKVRNYNNGIETGTDIVDVTIDAMNINDNFSNGFFGKRTVTNLTIKNSNLNNNGFRNNAQTGSVYRRGIMFESQGGTINNLVIDNNNTDNNGLVGIDISGLIPINGMTIHNNRSRGNFDSQIGVSLGNNLLTGGPVTVTNNKVIVSKASRFGIEIKNPLGTGAVSGNGSIVVSGNIISVASHTGSVRDLAAIAVMRRKDGHAIINDLPQGVQVTGNTISDFQNVSGDAFGIVLGGTGHFVSGNIISNTKYSIQLQKGNTNFNNNESSPNSLDFYFERDNSADVCVEFGTNTITGSGDPRLVTGAALASATLPGVKVTNTTWPTRFCTIQQAIDFTATTTGHTIRADAGIYPENVTVSKSVMLQGPNFATSGTGARIAEAVIIPGVDDVSGGTIVKVTANDVKLEGLTIDGANTAFPANIVINGSQTHAAFGILAFGGISGLNVQNNIIKNISKHGIDLDAGTNSTKGNLISNNLFDNIPRYNASGGGFYGRGILLGNNFYASIINNTFSRVERGIQTNNFSKAILEGTWEIKGNMIKAYNIGAFINLHYQLTSDLLFENNTIEKDATNRAISSGDALPDEDFTGLEVFSVSNAVKVLVKGGLIKNAVTGISSWNNGSSNHVTIDGVSFDNNITAVLQSNTSRYNDALDSEIDVKNVTLTDGNAQKAFVAEDFVSGSHALSSINMVENNTITAGNNLQYPFYLKDGSKARIKVGGTQVTLSTQDAVTFSNTGVATAPNLVINAGFVVNLAGNDLRVVNVPSGGILEMNANFTAPNKVTKNPILINGGIWFTNGVLNSGDGNIEFGNTASDIMTGTHAETAASYILGKALMASRNVGGSAIDMLGVKMAAGPDLGTLIIIRTTSTTGSITPAFPNNASIRTVWDIMPSNTSASRGDVQFRYLNSPENLNAQNVTKIYAYRYNAASSQWEKKSALRSSVLTDAVYTTESFGIAQFSSWTLSSAEPGPDLTPTLDFSGTLVSVGGSQTVTVYVENIVALPTTATVSVTIVKPLGSSGLTLSVPSTADWTVSDGGATLIVTLNGNIGALDSKSFIATISRVGGSAGSYNFTPVINNGSGGESNFGNNRVTVILNKN